ncbi:MAG: hypothetical protein ACR2N3_14425 [Pyrinomonadaceae bacterium]
MNSLERNYEVTRGDLVKGKALSFGMWLAPVLFSIIPALLFFILSLFYGAVPLIFFSLISLVAGFLFGLIVSGILLFYRGKWLAQIRERIAVDGIKAEEVGWFQPELTSAEKKSLKEMDKQDRLLADAYRETLASRLTAARIIKKSNRELLLVRRRQNKLKYLKSERSEEFQEELKRDGARLQEINKEAKEMRTEAETRLQMIESAVMRGSTLADSELALKKLSARAEQLPLALENLKMEDEIRQELESETEDDKK